MTVELISYIHEASEHIRFIKLEYAQTGPKMQALAKNAGAELSARHQCLPVQAGVLKRLGVFSLAKVRHPGPDVDDRTVEQLFMIIDHLQEIGFSIFNLFFYQVPFPLSRRPT